MARLPDSIDSAAPQGQRPSTAAVRPTDFGLGDLAQGVERFAEATKVRDAKTAEAILRQEQAKLEPALEERGAAYDGQEPGFANRELGAFDGAIKPLLDRSDLPEGVRLALREQVGAYKDNYGQRAIHIETGKRAGIVADRERVTRELAISDAATRIQTNYAARRQERLLAYDGSQPGFAEADMADFDEAVQAEAETAPEANRKGLMSWAASARVKIHAEALQTEGERFAALVTTKAKSTTEEMANAIISNPTLYATSDEAVERLGDGLPPGLRVPLQQEAKGLWASARVQGLILQGDLTQAQGELESGRYDKVLDPKVKLGLLAAVRAEGADQARGLIRAIELGEDVDPAALTSAATISKDRTIQSEASYRLLVGAEESKILKGGVGSRASQQGMIDFVMNRIEGGSAYVADDAGKGATRYGINKSAYPEVDIENLTAAQAAAIHARILRGVTTTTMPPALQLVAYDTAVNQGPGKARQWLAESGGDVTKFMGLRETHYRELAKSPRYAKYLKSWLGRLSDVSTEAARLQSFANLETGAASDPMAFAVEKLGLRAPALPDIGAAPAAWAAAWKGRLKVGQQMNRDWNTPVRLLTSPEAAMLKDQIEADPLVGLQLAQSARDTVGPQAARQLMSEVGQGDAATVQLHIAHVASVGSPAFARQAAQGVALKKQKITLDKSDSDEIAAQVAALEKVMPGAPEWAANVRQTAEAAAIMQAHSGGVRSAEYNVNSALGATRRDGLRYGGLSRLNGAPVLLPTWLAEDYADDALAYLGEVWAAGKNPPMYANGRPIPAAQIARGRLQAMPNGRYRLLSNGGQIAVRADGSPFDFDFDQAAAGIRNRLGRKAAQETR